jgi:hypothetical protein
MFRWCPGLLLLIWLCSAPAQADTRKPELRFQIIQGAIQNEVYRDGPVAAHVTLKSGTKPRLVVAFPAGNSGVGLWFSPLTTSATWGPVTRIKSITRRPPGGGIRHGVVAETSISAPTLGVTKAVLSNVRVLRDYGDYGHVGKIPASVESPVSVRGRIATWERRRIDGAAGYLLSVEALNGRAILTTGDNQVRFETNDGAPLRLRFIAMTGDPALSPIPASALFTASATDDQQLRDVLTFLSYDEKLIAGSWRFNTYFGRDTLMSARLLMPAITPHTIEAVLRGVLLRLNALGEVAHEEDLEEYTLLTRQRLEEPLSAEPILDYKMIDDDYMLAPVIAHYLLDTADGRSRAQAFLAQKSPAGMSYAALLASNLLYVVNSAKPFARAPVAHNMIALKSGLRVGQWRDSEDGLAGGRYPYDVNAVLVPAALRAAARFAESGLLNGYQGGEKVDSVAIAAVADVWEQRVSEFFLYRADNAQSKAMIRSQAAAEDVDPSLALAALGDGDTVIHALALDSAGQPIPVMNSDEGFALLFGQPSAASLKVSLEAIMRPFPAGLITPAGMLVANPMLAEPAVRSIFGSNRYHGMVIWSWQQALMAAGIAKQRQRSDLPGETQELLAEAAETIQRAIDDTLDARASELWSWSATNGKYRREAYGQRDGDETDSNALQLWSTVFLGHRKTPPNHFR